MDEKLPTSRQVERWISPITILFVLYAIFFLPFWQPLLLAFLFACACSPLVNYIHARLHGSEKWSPYILMGLLTTLVIGTLVFAGIRIFSLLYTQFQNTDDLTAQFEKAGTVKSQLVQWMKHIPFLNDQNIEAKVDHVLTNIGTQAQHLAVTGAKAFVVMTPEIVLNLFIFLVSFAVLLVWGSKKWEFISRFPGLGSRTDQSHYQHFEKVCAISIGSIFLTGLLQATLVGIGAAITGYPVFISFLMAFILSLIPVLGAASVPVFLSILSFASGETSSGIILLVTSLIAGTADNIVRAWLFSKAADTNPIVSLLALLGGISLFGFPGLFIAPIVEQLVMSYVFNGNLEKKKAQTAPNKKWRSTILKSPPRPI